MKDLGVAVRRWHFLRVGGGRMVNVKDACQEDINKNDEACRTRLVKKVKNEIGELKQSLWFEPIKAILTRKPNHSWTASHAAQAKSFVISGAWTQKKYPCTETQCTVPLYFSNQWRDPNTRSPHSHYHLELIRRSHHTIVMEKRFPWRFYSSREQPSVLMWASQSHAAVGRPSRITSDITPLHDFTFRVLRETILCITVLLDSCVHMFRHPHFNA